MDRGKGRRAVFFSHVRKERHLIGAQVLPPPGNARAMCRNHADEISRSHHDRRDEITLLHGSPETRRDVSATSREKYLIIRSPVPPLSLSLSLALIENARSILSLLALD